MEPMPLHRRLSDADSALTSQPYNGRSSLPTQELLLRLILYVVNIGFVLATANWFVQQTRTHHQCHHCSRRKNTWTPTTRRKSNPCLIHHRRISENPRKQRHMLLLKGVSGFSPGARVRIGKMRMLSPPLQLLGDRRPYCSSPPTRPRETATRRSDLSLARSSASLDFAVSYEALPQRKEQGKKSYLTFSC